MIRKIFRPWVVTVLVGVVALGIGIGIGGTSKSTNAANTATQSVTTVTPVPNTVTQTVTAPPVTETATPAPAPTITQTVTANAGGSGGVSGGSGSGSGGDTVTFIAYGNGSPVDITYGAAGSNQTGTEPMDVTENIPSSPPAYYAISAQLQGSGTVSVIIKVDGQQISSGVANGGYNIASAEIGQNPVTGAWEDDNSG